MSFRAARHECILHKGAAITVEQSLFTWRGGKASRAPACLRLRGYSCKVDWWQASALLTACQELGHRRPGIGIGIGSNSAAIIVSSKA